MLCNKKAPQPKVVIIDDQEQNKSETETIVQSPDIFKVSSLKDRKKFVSLLDHLTVLFCWQKYEALLTANLDLCDYAGKGKKMIFDCMPIHYGPEGLEKYTKEELQHWVYVDKNGKVVFDEENHPQNEVILKDGKFLVQVDPEKELSCEKNYLPAWIEIINCVYSHKGKTNLMEAAYEGGFRLQRRYHNMNMAFTFGHKLQYSDLDDPNLKKKLVTSMKIRDKQMKKMKKERELIMFQKEFSKN